MDPILKRKLEWEKKETQAMIQNKKLYLRMYPLVHLCRSFFFQTNVKSNFSVRKRSQEFQRAQGV